jgi:hypothetical protein
METGHGQWTWIPGKDIHLDIPIVKVG